MHYVLLSVLQHHVLPGWHAPPMLVASAPPRLLDQSVPLRAHMRMPSGACRHRNTHSGGLPSGQTHRGISCQASLLLLLLLGLAQGLTGTLPVAGTLPGIAATGVG
mmetsp:Transcript_28695/g.63197  ORF Transcript_28695/g.63197 Transcript_28695/m.63197 type:complete len:106 (-) Transcript_28695:1294-1611(-)